jgi:hypothetical protein
MFGWTRKPQPPRCPECGRRLRPVEVVRVFLDGSAEQPANADWYCDGGWFGHGMRYFTTKPPTAKPDAAGDFGGDGFAGELRAVGG